jgi:transcriptional regulator with XRE-family HTH domain
MLMATIESVGDLLREWRQRRRMSQLDLACEAGISPAQLSCLETGRQLPDRDILLRLAEQLEVPLRERNLLLASAGFEPLYQERPLDDPALLTARVMIDTVLAGHEPYPAVAVDRHATVIAANPALWRLVAGADPMLMRQPVNLLRLFLHPAGLAPRISNLMQWRTLFIGRLRRQIDASGDPFLSDLLEELRDYPLPRLAAMDQTEEDEVVVPLRLATIDGTVSFFTTTTTFTTAVDITLSELTIESFYPADAATADIMHRLAVGSARGSAVGQLAAAG